MSPEDVVFLHDTGTIDASMVNVPPGYVIRVNEFSRAPEGMIGRIEMRDPPPGWYWREMPDAAARWAAPWWALTWVLSLGKFGRLPWERVQ